MTEVLSGPGHVALPPSRSRREAVEDEVSFTGAGLLLIPSAIGLAHGRRVPAETEVLAKTVHTSTVTA